jgi:4,4'-diaponeurosporenoate glycosyltransferase
MHDLLDVIAILAALVVIIRLRKYFGVKRVSQLRNVSSFPAVSVIVPARNEERNIASMLASLKQSSVRFHEIIVVDDNSNDNTRLIASQFNVKIIAAGPRPEGWAGKNWACHVGSQAATGAYLLFTDADTVHDQNGLRKAMAFMTVNNADMLSAPSFHRNTLWWEKLLGPFHCIIHCGASPFDRQTAEHVYAIGQYILIKKETYEACGGHQTVRSEVAEDVALAKTVVRTGSEYVVFTEGSLFSVQMYNSFSEFCQGWVRLLRLGMRQLSFRISFNSVMPLLAMNFWNLYSPVVLSYTPLLATLLCFAIVQRRLGDFSITGVLVFPLSVALFLALSCYAVAQELLKAPIAWKGRVYGSHDDVAMQS